MIKKLVSVDELYAAFRRDIMGGLNYDRILKEAKPVDAIPIKWILEQAKKRDKVVASILMLTVQEWEDGTD